MATNPYPFTRVFPKEAGVTGVSNVGAEVPVTLTPGIPGYMYTADAITAEAAEQVEFMAGNSKRNLWVLAAVTCVAAGAGPAAAEGTLTFAGGPADADSTVTVTAAVDGGADIVVTHSVTKDDVLNTIVGAVQASIETEVDLTASAFGDVVIVAPASGTNLTKLEVSIA